MNHKLTLIIFAAAFGLSAKPACPTLVVVSSNRIGTVLCADRRVWDPVRGGRNQQKIVALGPAAAFAITGVAQVSDAKLHVLFDVQREIIAFYRHRGVRNLESSWTPLLARLRSGVQHLHAQGIVPSPAPGSTDDVLFEAIFIYRKHGSTVTRDLKYHADDRTESSALGHDPYVVGETEVTLRLLKPKAYPDARFDDVPFDKLVAKVWDKDAPKYPEALDPADSIYFANWLIGLTAERQFLFRPEPLVSPEVDCALVSSAGIRWLERNHSSRRHIPG